MGETAIVLLERKSEGKVRCLWLKTRKTVSGGRSEVVAPPLNKGMLRFMDNICRVISGRDESQI